jgi:DNA polymerase
MTKNCPTKGDTISQVYGMGITIDFETRSKADLKKVGAWVYAEHESTSVLCLAYKIDDAETKIWRAHKEDPLPEDLFIAIASGEEVEAHNAFFELCIWEQVCVARMGWPKICRKQWRCSAAKCAAHSLPRSLGEVAYALGLETQKDASGRRIMMKLSKPRKPTKTDPSVWHEKPEDLEKLYAYCITDVEVEHAVSKRVPDLIPEEQELRLLDQEINCRGVSVDKQLVDSAIAIFKQVEKERNAVAQEITDGAVGSVSERDKVMEWAEQRGYPLKGYTKEDIVSHLADKNIPDDVREVLTIRQSLGKISVAKYPALKRLIAKDGAAHGLLLYHGANTGRWAGKLFQPQNLPKGNIKDAETCIGVIKVRDAYFLESMYGEPMNALSSCIRGCLKPEDGKKMVVADYAAIEARVVMWMAGSEDGVEAFRKNDAGVGEDIYKIMAGTIYKKDPSDIQSGERQLGKTAILGAGFGMGGEKFFATCTSWGIDLTSAVTMEALKYDIEFLTKRTGAKNASPTDRMLHKNLQQIIAPLLKTASLEEIVETMDSFSLNAGQSMARYIIHSYREKYPEVAGLWYGVQDAAFDAVAECGKEIYHESSRTTWFVKDGFLYARLPSGRCLAYCEPEIRKVKTSWGEVRDGVTFMGVDPYGRVGARWVRQGTYGGKLVENIVQGTARDLMAYAMKTVERHGYEVILSVHDELITQTTTGTVKELEELMSDTPTWADGCPVSAEGWEGDRYRK